MEASTTKKYTGDKSGGRFHWSLAAGRELIGRIGKVLATRSPTVGGFYCLVGPSMLSRRSIRNGQIDVLSYPTGIEDE